MKTDDSAVSSANPSAAPRDAAAGREESRIAAAYARRDECIPPDRYSYFDPANLMMVQTRERRVLRLLARNGCQPLGGKRILEVGCGNGHWLRQFIQWGARPENLVGVDLLPARVAEAARLSPSAVDLRCASAAALDFPDGTFDVVLQSTVFTSILNPSLKQQIAREMVRVVKPAGIVLWYDFLFNNRRNPDVRAIGRAEIARLFPGCRVSLERITLAPPLARLVAPYSRTACLFLEMIPLLRTHYLGTIYKA
jgi:ubiquinone/menaquinone biosynthesis C-methylase UbiE